MNQKRAIVLLSGGLDSSVVLSIALSQGRMVDTISFDYSQRHKIELQRARQISALLECKHTVIKIDSKVFQGTALVNTEIEIPQKSSSQQSSSQQRSSIEEIPITYVPARNILFLSYALAFAESNGIQDIFLGVNSIDYSGYPDCRPEFIESFQRMAELGMKSGIHGRALQIHTPLIHLSKKEIIQKGKELGTNYSLTSSCYNPNRNGNPCGLCESCHIRAQGFQEAGLGDPLVRARPLS